MRTKVAIAIIAGLLGAGCSFSFSFGDKKLDMDKIESGISDGLEEQLDVTIDAVDCPDEVKIEEGDTFDCDVTAEDGTSGVVTVKQTDDEGNITWNLN